MTTVVDLPPVRAVQRRSAPGLVTIALLSIAIAGFSIATYAQGTLAELAAAADDDGPNIAGAFSTAPGVVQAAFYLHITGGILALILGPAQFSGRLRARAPRLHRASGRTYLVAVGLGALSALVIAPWNSAGLVGLAGFGTLGVLWLVTGWRALAAARNRDFAQHQAWMIRNYALSFAAPTLRLWLGLLVVGQMVLAGGAADLGVAFDNAYAVVPFLCWLPNLVVAEWLIRRRGLPAYRITP